MEARFNRKRLLSTNVDAIEKTFQSIY